MSLVITAALWLSSMSYRTLGYVTSVFATYHPSRKLFKLDEPDMQDTAREAGTTSLVIYSYGPPPWSSKSRAISLNLHTAAL